MRFDLSEGFPLLTTKKMNITNIVSELLWFIAGDTNIKYLLEYNNHIWTDWALERYIKSDEYTGSISKNENLNFVDRNIYKKEREEFEKKILSDEDFNKKYGNLGPVYGKQWRNFNGVDQLKDLIVEIKTNPSSRRLILSAWNPKDIPNMALAPCHVLIQFYVNEGKLSCQLYQRSNDFPLGVPYNIASYAILTHLIAKECNLKVGEFIHTGGDVHIYNNQLEIVKEQFNRLPYEAPELVINNFKSIFEVKPEDIELKNYNSHNFIKIPVTKEGLEAIRLCDKEGINVTATAVLSAMQALAAAKNGASYVAPYVNRLENIGQDAEEVIVEIKELLKDYKTEILAASFKNVKQFKNILLCGAEAATVAPDVLETSIWHPYTDKSVIDFEKDWERKFNSSKVVDALK